MHELRELIHGGDLAGWTEQCPEVKFTDFSANINPMGLPEGVRRELRKADAHYTRYPDQRCRELRRALSGYENVPEDVLLCGNGAADLIYRIAYAVRPQAALMLAPTFAEYEQALLQVKSGLHFYQLFPGNDFAVEEDILKRIPNDGAVFLCNPNNPTGRLMEPSLMLRMLERCAEKDTVLVVDECFLDFLAEETENTMKRHLAEFGNLLILRAFTKIFAMPGLRLGYLMCSDPELLGRIDRAGAPWSVSVPAQLSGIAAVKETSYLLRSRQMIREERAWLEAELASSGFQVYSGQANFILFHSGDAGLAERLCETGFLLRDCSNFRGLGPGWFRTAVRTREENNALIRAIKEL